MLFFRNRQWRPDWRLWGLALLFFPLLLWLGTWQVERGQEKAAQQAHWKSMSARHWPLPQAPAEGQPVMLAGHYLAGKQWLLDNRTREGRAGYEVLSLFQPVQGPVVVINRGWLPGTRDRSRLPDVSLNTSPRRVEARVAKWPSPPVLGSTEPVDSWPARVQSLTYEMARETSGLPLSPVFLRLADSEQPGALVADWAPSRMDSARHYGYAVQWFGLAFALAVLTVVASFRKEPSFRKDRSEENCHD